MKIKKKLKNSEKFQVKEKKMNVFFGSEKEVKITHYSSFQKILLVGEGDFSFALCLAKAFGSARNMVATSLNSKEELEVNYSKAMSNLRELEYLECKILHGVDVHTMLHHPLLMKKQFDRIVFNFPHSGYSSVRPSSEKKKFQTWLHKNLIMGYFKSSSEMLTKGGEIHVTQKASFRFEEWEIEKLAEEAGLYLVEEEEFSLWDYPGYNHKRGVGICDLSFRTGVSSTFRFAKRLYPRAASSFHPGALSISTWSADIVDMACTYLETLERKKSNRGHTIFRDDLHEI